MDVRRSSGEPPHPGWLVRENHAALASQAVVSALMPRHVDLGIASAAISSIRVNPRCLRRETRITPIVFLNFPAFQSLPNSDALTTTRPTLLSCRWRHVFSSHEPDNSRSTLFVTSTPYTAAGAAGQHQPTSKPDPRNRNTVPVPQPDDPSARFLPAPQPRRCLSSRILALEYHAFAPTNCLNHRIPQPARRTQRKKDIPKSATPSQSHVRAARGHACGNMERDDAPRA